MGKMNILLASAAFAFSAMTAAAQAETVKIALVVKALGIGFFDAANKGAQEAAKELGDVEVIYTGPTKTTAEGQIEVIDALIAQKVNAIAVSANDKDALVPVLKKRRNAASPSFPGTPALHLKAAPCTSTRHPTR